MRRSASALSLVLALAALWAIRAAAQPPSPGPPETPPAAANAPPASASPSARQLKRRFEQARELLASDNESEGARILQSILDSDEDELFSPDAHDPTRERSLKSESQALLATLTPAGRETYEKQYGPVARRMLAEAVADGDTDLMAQVVRRFFQTQAGCEAAYRLASDHLDHGRALTAALGFERLRQAPSVDEQFEPSLSLKAALAWQRAGQDDKALECLLALKHKYRGAALTLGGREISLFEESDQALVWLTMAAGPRVETDAAAEQWVMVRGDARRNAASSGGGPYLNRSWRASTIEGSTASPDNDGLVARQIQERIRATPAAEDGAPTPMIPCFQPLVVGNLVVLKGIGDLRAYELATGKLAWASSDKDRLLHNALDSGGGPASNPAGSLLALLVATRVWSDATAGTLSSDGELVFTVEDLELTAPFPVAPMQRPPPAQTYNRLTACDVRTGRMVWEAGGPLSDGSDELSGVFFLGAPLVLDRRLYCLTESGSEIRLFALEPRTGEVVWSQTLNDDSDLVWDMQRRRCGLTPSYDGGILVCPTGADQATAVDLTARSLLWRYRFRTRTEAYDPRPFFMAQRAQQAAMRGQALPRVVIEQKHWLDSEAIISDARVLLTPRDGNELHCLNLIDGSLAWKVPRGEALFVAGVHAGRVVVVGRTFVQALRMADGTPAWSEPASVPVPAGRGFIAGDQFHLPLSTAEVATIDLSKGRIIARARSLTGRVPGNLVGVKGHIVSQGADFIEVFPQLELLEAEIAQSLSQSPDDPAALALRGEMRLQKGEVREGYADLKRALELKSDDEGVRALLVGSLLEGLRVDFAMYRGLSTEFEKLLTAPEERAAYLWLQAAGLQRMGESAAAFTALLQFADPAVANLEYERLDSVLSVRRDRLVRSRAQQLVASAEGDDRTRLEAAWRARVAELEEQADPDASRRFLTYFGATLEAPDLARSLVLAPSGGEWLDEELFLQRFMSSGDAALAAAATARQVTLLLDAERPADAAPLIARIERHWPDAAALDGKTGRELAAEWRNRPEVERALAAVPAWPAGRVEAEREPNVTSAQNSRSYAIPLEGERGTFFRDVTLEISPRLQDFVARDALGRPLWKLRLESRIETANFMLNRGYVCEHLLLVTVGQEVIAIDTLGTAESPGPRILWRMNLIDTILPRANANLRRRMPFIQAGDQTGTVGPVTRDYVALTRGRRLLAVDPLTGKPLWTRDGISPGSELFGDEELLFYVQPDTVRAGVFRAIDGQFLGTRPLPAAPARLDTIGRRAVLWRNVGGLKNLTLQDVAADEAVWQREFAPGALVTLIDETEAAVLEPDGAFTILGLANGRDRLVSEVDRPVNAQQIAVLRSPDLYVLVCREPAIDNNEEYTQVAPQSLRVDGHLHGIDRTTGAKLWTVRVERQGLDPNQPSDLPVLTFLSQTIKRPKNGQVTNSFHLLCVDKRTGRILYQDQQGNEGLHFVDYLADLDLFQLDIRLFRSTLRLSYSDKPWAD